MPPRNKPLFKYMRLLFANEKKLITNGGKGSIIWLLHKPMPKRHKGINVFVGTNARF
jgi:hypothetical protein